MIPLLIKPRKIQAFYERTHTHTHTTHNGETFEIVKKKRKSRSILLKKQKNWKTFMLRIKSETNYVYIDDYENSISLSPNTFIKI